ncbi:Hypothetical protein FKW44_025113 [Caligus rogercresseyi]|uniref:Uncharacterized protein n=1 Tax=Caligus rogercresseyi TaxID=217165 RepID=A0A7T8JTH5_CALRO|nr:Hypothetical protein FKW44_025113 [Caligus rogercresseyi]
MEELTEVEQLKEKIDKLTKERDAAIERAAIFRYNKHPWKEFNSGLQASSRAYDTVVDRQILELVEEAKSITVGYDESSLDQKSINAMCIFDENNKFGVLSISNTLGTKGLERLTLTTDYTMWRNAVECIIEVTGASIQQVVAQIISAMDGGTMYRARMSCPTSKRLYGARTRVDWIGGETLV